MTIQPVGRISVEEEGRQILSDCRCMAVGVQALLGFQLLSILTPARVRHAPCAASEI